MYYCTNAVPAAVRDSIGMRASTLHGGAWTWGEETVVLSPAAQGWDSVHVCDPDVVKGRFSGANGDFSWALFYLGTDTLDSTHNQIGVAYASSPAGPWVRGGGNPLVSYAARDSWWGVGQPTVVSEDEKGRLLLAYTRGDGDGTRMVARRIDLSNIDAPVVGSERPLTTAGLTEADGSPVILHNGALAIDVTRRLAWLVRERHPFDRSTPSFIATRLQIAFLPETALDGHAGAWDVFGEIGPLDTGAPRNHNASILKDSFGRLPDPGTLEVYVSTSRLGPSHLWSYRIHRQVFTLGRDAPRKRLTPP